MTYLIYVAGFGLAAVLYLWLRDLRIFSRTRLPGYRTAAYRGVACSALALLGFLIALYGPNTEILGLGLILAALYLQGRVEREKIWHGESTLQRFLGQTERINDRDPK
ncbi:MAG: ABC transporter permease [Methanomicrobiaceae archaeon]|uniref:Uncharacterized protein n=1 Tax=hydrocarbon metagenome TaxID=938273 RepID=A0A0W8FJK2_9ZZZZ|nr:ABC transporter permease [Methanomicrobiaceae archaeon]MDD5418831.1 ABC transporter permease [Methanomicrobiaceae archaeon]